LGLDPRWIRPGNQRDGLLKGQLISVLGCTTIHGSQHPISYIVSAEQQKAGAALCQANRLSSAVRAARSFGPVVVALHGGNEYQSDPTPPMQQMVDVARRAGATLVLNHHFPCAGWIALGWPQPGGHGAWQLSV